MGGMLTEGGLTCRGHARTKRAAAVRLSWSAESNPSTSCLSSLCDGMSCAQEITEREDKEQRERGFAAHRDITAS